MFARPIVRSLGATACLTAAAVADCGPDWYSTFSGTDALDGAVWGMTTFDDGTGPALYAGGAFVTAGGTTVNGVARWDGAAWTPLGTGMNDEVLALQAFDAGDGAGPRLYAGGQFTTADGAGANRMARWNGAAWEPLDAGMDAGMDGWVRHLALYDDGDGPALYAGGQFSTAGGAIVNNVAKWDGVAWSALGAGVTGGAVLDMTAYDDGSGDGPQLYVGGWFHYAGGSPATQLARWDGTTWSSIGVVGGAVRSLAVFDDGLGDGPALYIAGHMGSVDELDVNLIARWNGTDWSDVGGGVDGSTFPQVSDLAVYDDGDGQALFVAGTFDTAGADAASRIAKWDGKAWSSLGAGIPADYWAQGAHTLQVHDDRLAGPALYVGGDFVDSPAGDAWLTRWGGCGPEMLGDLNGDGVVDVIDLIALLMAWGVCPPGDCPADLDGDGAVGVGDLVALIGAWG